MMMGDAIDDFRALKQFRAAMRGGFGVPCPVCQVKLPRAHPKILQPQQVCRAHKPHYQDPRQEPTQAEIDYSLKQDTPS